MLPVRRGRAILPPTCCAQRTLRKTIISQQIQWSIKIGRLDFKAHGLLARPASSCSAHAMLREEARYLIMASIPVTTGQPMGLRLLSHAPEKTVIARGIVTPHREAYKRAIGVVLYVNVRLAWACDLLGARVYGVACALLAAKLTPTKALDKRNTLRLRRTFSAV